LRSISGEHPIFAAMDRRPLRWMIRLVIQHHPHGSSAHFR